MNTIDLKGNTLIVSRLRAGEVIDGGYEPEAETIDTEHLVDEAVTEEKLEDGAVTDDKVASDAEIAGTKIEISELVSAGESITVSGDLETVLKAILDEIDPSVG